MNSTGVGGGRSRTVLAPAFAATCMLAAGCSFPKTDWWGDTGGGAGWTRGTPLGRAAPFALGAEVASSGLPALDAAGFFSAGRDTFTPWDGEQTGVLVIERDPPSSGRPARWHSRRFRAPAREAGSTDLTPESEQTFVLTSDPVEGIALAEEVQHAERVEVVFDPPLLVIPTRLPAGAPPIEQQLKMRVHPLGDRSQLRSSGPARNRVRYAADQTVRLAGQEVTARRIESTLTADLAPAKVVNRSSVWFVDGRGMVAQREEERTTIFGVPSRHNRAAWAISPAP